MACVYVTRHTCSKNTHILCLHQNLSAPPFAHSWSTIAADVSTVLNKLKTKHTCARFHADMCMPRWVCLSTSAKIMDGRICSADEFEKKRTPKGGLEIP